MITFVGAGPGAIDLITVRGQRALSEADVIIYAGSLVNPELLQYKKEGCAVYNSASMTLEEVVTVMLDTERAGKKLVRLHTGDPSIYGAVREQMDCLDAQGVTYTSIPGVSSFLGAAAALNAEFTLPGVSQTIILTRLEGRTPVPPEESIEKLASHQASMAIFLAAGMLDKLSRQLLDGGYRPDTPAVLVYKATWEEQKIVHSTVASLAEDARQNGLNKTTMVFVGNFLGDMYERSRLYDPSFTHGFRKATS